MVAERALSALKSEAQEYFKRPIPVLENEKPKLEKSIGIDLTTIIVSHLNLGTFKSLPHQPNRLLAGIPSFVRLRSLDKFMGPTEEVELFTQLFASTIAKTWNADLSNKNLAERERKLAVHCLELRRKGYDLKRTIREVSHHFNLSEKDALEIAKKEYFTIDDLAKEMDMNRGSAKNRVKEALKEDNSIIPERFGGLEVRRTYISRNHWGKIKSAVESLIQQAKIALPDNKELAINGRVRKRIMKKLAEKAKAGKGLSLDEILSLYPKKDRHQEREEAHHVIAALRENLQSFGWTIENYYVNKGPRSKHISAYFLRKTEPPTSSPVTVFPKG